MKKTRIVSILCLMMFTVVLCSAQQVQAPLRPNWSSQKLAQGGKTGTTAEARLSVLESRLTHIDAELKLLRADQDLAQATQKADDLATESTLTCGEGADELPSNLMQLVGDASTPHQIRLNILACLILREHGARVQAEQKLAASQLALAQLQRAALGDVDQVDTLRSKQGQVIERINELLQFKQHICASFRYSPPPPTLSGNELRFACN